jgi:hypothetical protein
VRDAEDEVKAALSAALEMREEAARELAEIRQQKLDQTEMIEASARAASEVATKLAAEAIVGLFTGKIKRDARGNWSASNSAELKPIWSAIKPTMDRLANWWEKFRRRVELLPEHDQPQWKPLVPIEESEPDVGPAP